jgi:hypothetical protein
MIAIANVALHIMYCWLKQWNSSSHSLKAIHFSTKLVNEERLCTWLTRAAYWARISISQHIEYMIC